MNFEISLLIKTMESIIEYLKNHNLEKIDIISDYYLNLESLTKFDVEKKFNVEDEKIKAEVNIGSIYDDIMEMVNDVNGINEISTVTIDRLAHILEYLSYYIQKSTLF